MKRITALEIILSEIKYRENWGKLLVEVLFFILCTDKKRKEKFPHIQRNRVQSHIWLTASSYMVKYLPISSYSRKPFLIYDFAPDQLWISLYLRKILFSFYQCGKEYSTVLQQCNVWDVDQEHSSTNTENKLENADKNFLLMLCFSHSLIDPSLPFVPPLFAPASSSCLQLSLLSFLLFLRFCTFSLNHN